tara:strand:- start:116 stop:523 length:408 start_codon:yes stop_codon:yes gene_type:complete
MPQAQKKAGAFRTIREVADHLEVEQHVLRFWETKFTQIKPMKRGGGRRYYRPEDISVLERIYQLLYKEGYTIKGAQKVLKGATRNQIAEASNSNAQTDVTATNNAGHGLTTKQLSILKQTLVNLKDMRKTLETAI